MSEPKEVSPMKLIDGRNRLADLGVRNFGPDVVTADDVMAKLPIGAQTPEGVVTSPYTDGSAQSLEERAIVDGLAAADEPPTSAPVLPAPTPDVSPSPVAGNTPAAAGKADAGKSKAGPAPD